jgi:hypothetical protein
MFPGDLTDMVPMMLLALAVGCGAPAIIYLAFKGTLRESKERINEQPEREKADKPQPPPSRLADRKDFLRLPTLVEGYVYLSKDILEMLIEEASAKQAEPTEEQAKPSGEQKPPLVRRIGA